MPEPSAAPDSSQPDPSAFTGERFVPGVPGEIVYEHVHRYAFARGLVRGRRVLDVACGEGYGSALLAGVAASVIGIDIDAATITRAKASYVDRPGLVFACASGAALPLPDDAVDIVVSFETIEHLPQRLQPAFVAELRRVLRPGGLLVLSAPNRPQYSEARGYVNPFHQHEHDRAELAELLSGAFPHQRWLRQRLWLGSMIVAEGVQGVAEAMAGDAAGVGPAPLPEAMYFVVVASDARETLAALALPARSLFSDPEDSELARHEAIAATAIRLDRLAGERLEACDRQTAHIQHLERLVAERDARILSLSRIVEANAQSAASRRESPPPSPAPPPPPPVMVPAAIAPRVEVELGLVDVVIPVYNAADDVEQCLASVLAHTDAAHAIVVIDDASPDPRIGALFAELAARRLPQLTLLRNERNLGFTGTANGGMALSRRDVVLLNSDTIVTAGWLDALRRCVASDPRIGTATPFSNNAEICSFPQLCVNQPWLPGTDPEPTRAAIAEAAVPCYPDLPTGVGFCMYVRRELIDRIGVFDPAFGAGYGEENDFCMRTHAAGYRNVLCDDAFVIHTGGRSFAGAKEMLGLANMKLLLERHPTYLDIVRDFIARDPLAPLREAARTALDRRAAPHPAVLHVLHGGGGTETHVRMLAESGYERMRHVVAIVRGDTWRVEEHRSDGTLAACQFAQRADEPPASFIAMLCAAFGVGLIHVHHLSGARGALLEGVPKCGVPFIFTVHSFDVACPTITLQGVDGWYCGGVTDPGTCNACLRAQQFPSDTDIVAWRAEHAAFLAQAAVVIAPSRWCADLLRRYYPDRIVEVVPHGLPPRVETGPRARQVVLMPHDGRETVAVLGAVGEDKGARRVERLAELARERRANVRFVVIGVLDTQEKAWQSEDATLTVNGRYEPRDLPMLLDYYQVRLVVYPSFGPETFSYTLSEAWDAGRAVLVPPIGALAERVQEHGAGWIMDEAQWRDDGALLDRIVQLVAPDQRDELGAVGRRAQSLSLPTLATMVARTHALYRDVMAKSPVAHGPIDRRRIVEAFGYRPWTPPAPMVPEPAPASPDVTTHESPPLANAALKFRRTLAGRALARLLPPSVRAAVWARLR